MRSAKTLIRLCGWVFAGRTSLIVGFIVRWLICLRNYGFTKRTAMHLIWLRECSGWSWHSLPVYAWMRLLSGLGPNSMSYNVRKRRICAPGEDSDRPAFVCSLSRIFTGCILAGQGCKISWWGQRRLLSDCADAQTVLRLRWTHMSKGTFCHVAARIDPGQMRRTRSLVCVQWRSQNEIIFTHAQEKSW